MAGQQVVIPGNQMNRVPPRGDDIRFDFFTYNISFSTLNVGTSQTNNINIQADSDFEIQKLSAFTIQTQGDQDVSNTLPPLTVLITDTGTGRQLMDVAVPISSLFGTGQLPFILPNTKILGARSVLSVQINNIATATLNYAYVQLSFIGRKIFRGVTNR